MLNSQYTQLNQLNQLNQYNQYSQPAKELAISKDIEIKFFRLPPPLLNNINLPLSGLYNNIDNTEEDKENPFMNKFSMFDLSTTCNINNLFTLTPTFGRVFSKETLEGLITFSNNSDNQVYIRDLEISLKIDANPETKTREQRRKFDIKLPAEGILMHKSMVSSVKFSALLDMISKDTIEIQTKINFR